MADTGSPWTGAGISLVSVAVGYLLNFMGTEWRTQRENRGHWLALRADILRCGAGARGYLGGTIPVPASRLHTSSYQSSFPALLRAELLSQSDVDGLTAFFDIANAFNYSMDLAQEAIDRSEPEKMNLENAHITVQVNRAKIKAEKITSGAQCYRDALTIVDGHLVNRTGHPLMFWKSTPK